MLLIDGPQGWKHPDHGTAFARSCEAELHTPAKTGLPVTVTPAACFPFVSFSIAVFDAPGERGWPRLSDPVTARLSEGYSRVVPERGMAEPWSPRPTGEEPGEAPGWRR